MVEGHGKDGGPFVPPEWHAMYMSCLLGTIIIHNQLHHPKGWHRSKAGGRCSPISAGGLDVGSPLASSSGSLFPVCLLDPYEAEPFLPRCVF